jgi:hypothetical protein
VVVCSAEAVAGATWRPRQHPVCHVANYLLIRSLNRDDLQLVGLRVQPRHDGVGRVVDAPPPQQPPPAQPSTSARIQRQTALIAQQHAVVLVRAALTEFRLPLGRERIGRRVRPSLVRSELVLSILEQRRVVKERRAVRRPRERPRHVLILHV